jgi:4-aminobutyrate aminotransferase-like enzyme
MEKKIKTKNRIILTKIPAPGTINLFNKISKLESRSMHGQIHIVWAKAKNFSVFDIAGNKFIDFTSTIFVSNIGHSNPRLKNYLKQTLKNNLIHSYAYINKIREKYLKKLIQFAGNGFEKAFLMSAGTEATEAAFKLMRMHGRKAKKRKLGIICLEGNWHGRTLGAQMMSGNKKQKEWIGYQDKNIHHLPFPYPWVTDEKGSLKFLKKSLQKLKKKINIKKDICGVMLESFQGWGAIFYPKKYVQLLSKICKKNNILLAFDEMQSGFSRTGRNFGFEHYKVKPDLICCGKGMGGGIPISGVIGKKKVLDLPDVGNMSSTHSANPIACSAGLAVLEEIKNKNLTINSSKKGKILQIGLKKLSKKYSSLFRVYGKGLIASMVFNKKRNININNKLKLLVEEAMRNGLLLCYTGRESIKIGPPLTITTEALKEALEVIDNSINKIFINGKN